MSDELIKKDYFPFIGSEEDYNYVPTEELPLFTEFDFDFVNNDFIIDETTKNPVVLKGNKALQIWIHKALLTNRYEHEIYSWGYGTELINLIGQKFSRGLTESEAFRFIKDSLLINPYILDVKNRGVSFDDDEVGIKIDVETIYGEVNIDVRR